MKNFIHEADIIEVQVADVKSGEPVKVGELVGVAVTDTNPETGVVVIRREGMYYLPVEAAADVSMGEPLYLSDTGVINDDNTGTLFGYAGEDIPAGSGTYKVIVAKK